MLSDSVFPGTQRQEGELAGTLTRSIKRRLWEWFGTAEHPAEWDGIVYGGGKISQRFWEYFIAVEMLDLHPESVVLDIGGGSPQTGVSLFPRLLAASGVRVIVLDKEFGKNLNEDVQAGRVSVENVTIARGFADFDVLTEQLRKHRPTHVSCLSVLEHAKADQQKGIFDALEREFTGERAVFTVEFHETVCHWEQQLTTPTLSTAVAGLRRYYLDRIERSPVHSMNAVVENQRLWYPLALSFERA